MQINNLLQMNDWEIKRFLKVVLVIQFAMWSAIGLDAIGLQIPIVRQLIGFIYLTFIPGIVILRILKLHKLGNIETLLYTVGLSIATLMFTGLFMNTVYPFFGISKPLSITSLIITISVIVLIFCALCYIRDKNFSDPSFIDIGDVISPPALFLCLIPFLAIFGTYLVNFHQNNIILMFLIVIIALIAILIGFDKFIPKNLYPFAVFVIAISLLYHTSLISMYLHGADIHAEYYFSNLGIINSHWNPATPNNVNAMLSIVTLAPAYSNICDMNLTWVFKIIYPLLFSLMPLGLYRVFQKQTNDKIAFLSCFFFSSVTAFYTTMLYLARQQVAELLLVLLILLMIDKDMNKMKRSFLFIVFGVSLTVSHYGLSYVYMLSLISVWLILAVIDRPAIQKLGDDFYAKFSRYKKKLAGNPNSLNIEERTIRSTFVLLFITFTLAWYMYVSRSSTFDTIVYIGDHIVSSIFTDFLKIESSHGLRVLLAETYSPLHHISKIINYLNQIFIIIGCIVLLLKFRELKFEREYAVFSIIHLALCLAGVFVPFFASSFNMLRLYHITLFFLAPFCVIGGITVFRALSRYVGVAWTNKSVRRSLKVLSVYFVIFLLYNTGFVYEVAEGHSYSISLSQEWFKKCGDATAITYFYAPHCPEQDIFSVKWISKNRNNKSRIYADRSHKSLLFTGYGMMWDGYILTNTTMVRRDSYIYLGYLNVHYGLMTGPMYFGDYWNITYISPLLDKKSMIYSNGGSKIYK